MCLLIGDPSGNFLFLFYERIPCEVEGGYIYAINFLTDELFYSNPRVPHREISAENLLFYL